MTSKPSPAPWADEPCPLISTVKFSRDKNAHSANHCAIEMAHTHNCLLRMLNSMIQQGPYIPDASRPETFQPETVTDFMFYTESWTSTVDHHHHTEEKVLFPSLEKLAGVPPGLIANLEAQHADFHAGLVELKTYTSKSLAKPESFRWTEMNAIIDGFRSSLVKHLDAEVDVLFNMSEYCGSDEMMECFKETERAATKDANMAFFYNAFPSILGGGDKTYEGGNSWPPLPGPMLFAIKYWFSRRHRGAWQFSPCDLDGKPVPLKMVPQSEH